MQKKSWLCSFANRGSASRQTNQRMNLNNVPKIYPAAWFSFLRHSKPFGGFSPLPHWLVQSPLVFCCRLCFLSSSLPPLLLSFFSSSAQPHSC